MKKFVVLYMASRADFEKMMENSTPEQQRKGMDAWMKWMDENDSSIVGGAPLGKTKRVIERISNIKNEIGGYSIVRPNRLMRAGGYSVKSSTPADPGAWIEIIEIMPLPGM